MNHDLLIVILIVGAGLLGGVTNFLRAEQEKRDFSSFLKNILMGISASILIPLFLNMISSNLLSETASESRKLFVFFGFCLIASLSSKTFIQNISDRLMSELRNTKNEVENIRTETKVIVDKETEPEIMEGEDDRFSQLQVRAFGFDEDAKKTLNALGRGYAWRTLRGITREINIPKERVSDSLNWLSSNNLAVKSAEKGRWGLTLEGRDILTKISQGDKQD